MKLGTLVLILAALTTTACGDIDDSADGVDERGLVIYGTAEEPDDSADVPAVADYTEARDSADEADQATESQDRVETEESRPRYTVYPGPCRVQRSGRPDDYDEATGLLTWAESEMFYTYNEDGLKVLADRYWRGEFKGTFAYEYDSEGRERYRRSYNANGEYRQLKQTTYDYQGRLLYVLYDFNLDGEVDEQHDFVWEGQTQYRIEREIATGKTATRVLEHDEHGRLVSDYWLVEDGRPEFRNDYFYDEAGRLESKRIWSPKFSIELGREVSYYDDHGNKIFIAISTSPWEWSDGEELLDVFRYDCWK
jgi:hypothetical protein